MAPIFILVVYLFVHSVLGLIPQPKNPVSRITVVGAVYCDVCSSNTFSRHSYFLPGVEVHIQCKFKANSPKTTEQITSSVNRTTNKYGVYKLEIPYVDGIDCVEGLAMESVCQATLITSTSNSSSSSACNVPGLKTTTNQISVKSKQDNLCMYSLNALSFRPSRKNATLCRNQREELGNFSLNSSKFFFPFYPPYSFPWPPLPKFPFPKFPCPSLPPSLPFPFPPLPSFPPTPSLFFPPPPPAFNLWDPRTWIPPSPPSSPWNQKP